MREPQHATDHAGVFGCPAYIADLCPAIFVFHLYHTFRDGQLLFGHTNHWPESHLLDFVLINLCLAEQE